VAAKRQTLAQVTEEIAQAVVKRAADGKHFGVVLIPEGLVEFIPEIKALISELNDLLAHAAEGRPAAELAEEVAGKLTPASRLAFDSLPWGIRLQLLADRDPHGNVQVSRIETEKLLIETVGRRVADLSKLGQSKAKFSALNHFFGYEGRCAAPSNFDADYCYGLGFTASLLVASGLTGYLSSMRGLIHPAAQWQAGGVPLTMMMNIEHRHGLDKPVIRKALVELDGKPFKAFASQREAWAIKDDFQYPGPIQYWGPAEVADVTSETLKLERQ
jgi:pyrophosphate--fructose-6-phosphate 1-phosphotransferase